MDYLERLDNVDPRLVAIVLAGATRYERRTGYIVRVARDGGYRTNQRQRELVAAGKSQTMRSYHRRGKAIDLAIISADKSTAYWDHNCFEELNSDIQKIALSMGAVVTWGGSWTTFVDAVHWQLETPSTEVIKELPVPGSRRL